MPAPEYLQEGSESGYMCWEDSPSDGMQASKEERLGPEDWS